ncbi:MAG: Gfo/Idh/MocA family oxidoreductase [Spirochaetes bacterium]|nr:Gfo/Idh/MocA family oxidoreductase [Spirochaetota bacterium]
MKQIRVAIIGQGRSGADIHAKYLVIAPEQYKIVAIADPIAVRRERAKKVYNYGDDCRLYADYRDIFKHKDIDVIINASLSHMHPKITKEIMEKGFNVVCEKPLARYAKEVDELIATAKRTKKVFAIFQQSRYAPYFRKVKEVVDSGILGRPVKIKIAFSNFGRRWDWQTFDAFYAGNLLNTGPHPLDQALRFLDYKGMPEVVCHMDSANALGGAEDFVQLVMKAPGRPVIEVEISSCHPYSGFTYEVQAVNGGLKGSMTHLDWKYFNPAEAPKQTFSKDPITGPDGTPLYCTEQLPWKEASWDVPQDQADLFKAISGGFYNMLYRTLTEGSPLEITPEQVRQQIMIIEECHRQKEARRAGKTPKAAAAKPTVKTKKTKSVSKKKKR